MNNKHQENGALTGPLIFTLPALNLVVILHSEWLNRLAETTIKSFALGSGQSEVVCLEAS